MLDLFRWRKLFLECLLIVIVKSDIFTFIAVIFLAVLILTNRHLMFILAWNLSPVVFSFIINVVLLLVCVVVSLELLLVHMLLIIMFSMHHLFFFIISHLLLLVLI